VQETTSAPGDGGGWANPARSKTKQQAPEGCSPEPAGRSLEGRGNVVPRWMAVTADVGDRAAVQNPAYRPTHSHL